MFDSVTLCNVCSRLRRVLIRFQVCNVIDLSVKCALMRIVVLQSKQKKTYLSDSQSNEVCRLLQ